MGAETLALHQAAKPSATRLRMVMSGLADPKLLVGDAVLQIYGPGGSAKFGRDIYYVLRAFDAIAAPEPA
ncbi:hypothetical protein [Caulobacter sp. S45]|uniref:hypothetical protein n=1 Tax=Caulobacter sp. S45 TaxID=1641861 RepID=UPI0015761C09|nr:hypothetical protein [Caulobacter sp. S45]